MNRFKIFWALLIIICLSGFQNAFADDPVITAIEVQGNVYVSNEIILQAVKNKVGDLFDESAINSDVKSIFSLGYFEDVSFSSENYKKGKKVIYEVQENPPIEKIVISGNTAYTSQEIKALMKVKETHLLNFQYLRDDIAAIQSKYVQDGYILSKITDVKTDPDTLTMDLNVNEGTVQGITVEGNTNSKDYIILRELKTRPGTVFNEKTLKDDIRRVFNLGYYSEVNPIFEPGTGKNNVIVILKISETRSSTVNFGGGFGEREGWFGFADLAINNLKGTAQNLLIKGQWGQELSTYQVKYFNPWFYPEKFGDRTSLTARFWNTLGRDIYLTQQDEFHVGWDMAVGKELRDNFKATYSFGSESVSPRSTGSFESYTSNFIGLAFSYDTRDVWMNPTQGAFHTISIKEGWKQTASAATNYTIYGLDANRFMPVIERLVFAWHLGTGLGVGDVPIGEIFWVGGPNTVRGYNLDEIQKGTRRLLANFEFRYTFNETFQGVVFFDWGSAWYTGFPEFANFIAGWGPGVRVNTPLGPIRLDYGLGTNKGFGSGILHFSIGQAF